VSEIADDISGRTLGRYRLDAFLGEGGMGRVYRAFDPTLGRAVAIKILPPALVHDRDRLERFIREARTASSLNHPNVVTIYEIGHEGETHFIAMELLEGETLRDRGKIELRRAIDLLAQVADGVAAAHAVGVIHRDLKPENIIITKSGFAKILDFGLAKLREAPATSEGATTPRKTDPGTVLGSVGYMSPEQAAGREVDHRSDIFSLGCILYEAVSGRRAFSGNSSIDTLHKIIHDDPQPLRELDPDVPPELQRIVRKCLAKDPDERYQSAKDMAIDLRTLRRDFDSQPRGVAPSVTKGRSGAWIAAAVIAAVVIAAVAVVLVMRPKQTARTPMTVTRITANGNVIGAAISPNGQYVGYAYSDAGKHSIFVKQLSTGSVLQLVPPGAFGTWGISFGPDSQSVYYAAKSGLHRHGELYQIPILGGSPREVLENIESSVTFSPDGKRLAFLRLGDNGGSSLVIANIDGTGEKTLVTKTPPNFLAPIFWAAPAWSADGKMIASAIHNGSDWNLRAYNVDDGSEHPLSHDTWSFVGHCAWLHDMSGFVVVGSPVGTTTRQLWFVSYPGGERRQITNDLFDYRMTSITSDDSALMTVAAEQTASSWYVPLAGDTPPVKLTAGKSDGLLGVAASANDIVYTSLENERWYLWSVDRAGNNRRQLNVGSYGGTSPSFSPDGKLLVYAARHDRDWVLMRSNADGSDAHELCPITVSGSFGEGDARITPDGRWVIFDQSPDGKERLWKVSIDGGTPVPMAFEGWVPAISPDGKYLAYGVAGGFNISPLAGGPPVRSFTSLSGTNYSMVRWMPDGKAVLHNAGLNDRKNIWLQPLDGSQAHPVTHFDDQYVLRFDVMPDGKALAVARGVLLRDAVLLKNFH